MKGTPKPASNWAVFVILAVLASWFSASPMLANAQGAEGNNDVYSSSGVQVGTSAFIDASVFAASGRDFCGVLQLRFAQQGSRHWHRH